MGNIKKAGSYFLKVANILLIAITINALFFIYIKQAPLPEAIAADFPATMSSDPIENANFDRERQQVIAEKINENIKIRSYAINVLICLNSFLSILIIYNLYIAANCLIEYDKREKVEELNIQKE
jgi:hypothetical protein